MKIIPTKFECFDCGFLVFTVEMTEDNLSKVVIEQEVNRESWPEISTKIQECLDVMQIEKEDIQ